MSDLTPRQTEVLAMIAEGLQCAEIAGRLGISRRTVEATTNHLKRRIGANSLAHAVAIAIGKGLISPPRQQHRHNNGDQHHDADQIDAVDDIG